MSVYIENDENYSFDFDIQELIDSLLTAVLKDANLILPVELNVVITDDEGIRQVNKEFRGIDKETDVLSFPALEYETPADFSLIDFDDCSYYNPDTDDLILGDMMLSYDRVVYQANEYGHSIKREVAFLVLHSLLHLLGYDHIEEAEEIIMREKQTGILESLGIMR